MSEVENPLSLTTRLPKYKKLVITAVFHGLNEKSLKRYTVVEDIERRKVKLKIKMKY